MKWTEVFEKHGIPAPKWSGVGDGWSGILDRLLTSIKEAGWDGKVVQVKEKFGGLRFYCEGPPSLAVDTAIQLAEEESYSTCENCGAPSEARTGGWVQTLCDACNAKRQSR